MSQKQSYLGHLIAMVSWDTEVQISEALITLEDCCTWNFKGTVKSPCLSSGRPTSRPQKRSSRSSSSFPFLSSVFETDLPCAAQVYLEFTILHPQPPGSRDERSVTPCTFLPDGSSIQYRTATPEWERVAFPYDLIYITFNHVLLN